MVARDALWRDHYRVRWLRPDAHRWIKPDAGRFLKPGVAIAAVFPVAETKYNPDQPREPAGSPEGGQWTIGGDEEEGGDIAFDPPDFDLNTLFDFDFDKLFEGLSDALDLSSIFTFLGESPSDETGDSTSVVGSEPEVLIPEGITPPVRLVSDTNRTGNSNDPDPFPKIPEERPRSSAERTAILRNLSGWMSRNAGVAGTIYGLADQIKWIGNYAHLIEANRDPPRTLEELQERAKLEPQRGYNNHHNVERSAARDGIPQSLIDDPSNILRIPGVETLRNHRIL